MNTISWNSVRNQVLADPEVKAEYEALKPEFDIARRIIAMRAAVGLTQREFAEQLGIKQSQLARIESGRQIPKIETLAKLAAAAGYELKVSFISQKPNLSQQQEIEPIRISISELEKKSLERRSRQLITT